MSSQIAKQEIEQIERHAERIRETRIAMVAELASLPPLTLECDDCSNNFPVEQLQEVDPGGWTMCAACAARRNEPNEWPSVMDHAEFPFADNH